MPTATEIAKHFMRMKNSVDLINKAIATSDTDIETIDVINRNVKHLELMLTEDFWTTEDMSDVNAAITAGNAYIA